ncbi:MAG: cache domain-containing protein [Hymenobacteraceae bacterium]|nr:cache domain-containing protein [Hymenobacteraceae bacterium]MDX5395861.1 cache domain-containing protein [Hymenobacteraceae bacterium]MDX5511916.1 cache domain-containing protein [Hymenobacteraceae bacterium]
MKKIFLLLIIAGAGLTICVAQMQLISFAVASDEDLTTRPAYSDSQLLVSVQSPQQDSTKQLVELVKAAAALIQAKGEAAFNEFRVTGSRWRQGEKYIFVLDPEGNMLVHQDSEMEGKNQLELKDINGKPIIRGLIGAATALPDKPEGWFHYEWPVPGGLLPRWKSSYVRLVKAPSGKNYIVGSGTYNNRMEREFVVDIVKNAVGEIEKKQENAFKLFYDPAGPYRVKDAYIFVLDQDGTELVNPAFRNLEGRKLMDLKDTQGKYLVQEMFRKVEKDGSGWVEYMWPKPGENVSTQKSAYVSKAKMGDKWVLVGSGVYLADAPKATAAKNQVTATELMTFVRNAAAELEKRGDKAYADFRKKGGKWFKDDTYLFVWSLDGTRVFHAADPSIEGKQVKDVTDATGRPYGKMFLEAANTKQGEGWVHYMYPEPGDIFPAWKSSFIKRVTFPSGKQYLVGSGIYNMQLDKPFIEDVVNRAAAQVQEKGDNAFELLRDKKGPFYFMDTYVFVLSPDGTELVNPAFPSLEGKNLLGLKDLHGKDVVKEQIAALTKNDSAWLEQYWYKPGDNIPALKQTYIRKVQSGGKTYLVGSGYYSENKKLGMSE